jgi:beta-glucosidase/6-phospho-beta-glucosidase/beta-galactosidase
VIMGSYLHREDFVHYASTCFKEFGDRVKHWITINEPGSFAIHGYDCGIEAPGRCSLMSRLFCKDGKSSTEPYIVAHNLLLAHAGAFHTYKQHFKVIHCKEIFYKVLRTPGCINCRKNKEASLDLHLIPNGMNHRQRPTKTEKQQHEQWTLSWDGETLRTYLICQHRFNSYVIAVDRHFLLY